MKDISKLQTTPVRPCNHVSGHKAGMAGIYNRSTYAAEKRAAVDLWAGHIKLVLAQAGGANVKRLADRRAS